MTRIPIPAGNAEKNRFQVFLTLRFALEGQTFEGVFVSKGPLLQSQSKKTFAATAEQVFDLKAMPVP